MSISRTSQASSKQSASRSELTAGTSLYAHLYRSMFPCRQPGCSISRMDSRVGRSSLSPRASGAKNRNASKCVHRIRAPSTTAFVPSAPRRSGTLECRTPCTSER